MTDRQDSAHDRSSWGGQSWRSEGCTLDTMPSEEAQVPRELWSYPWGGTGLSAPTGTPAGPPPLCSYITQGRRAGTAQLPRPRTTRWTTRHDFTPTTRSHHHGCLPRRRRVSQETTWVSLETADQMEYARIRQLRFQEGGLLGTCPATYKRGRRRHIERHLPIFPK